MAAVLASLVVLGACAAGASDPGAAPTATGGAPSAAPTPQPGAVLYLTADELASGELALGDRVPDLSAANNAAFVAAKSQLAEEIVVVPKEGGGRAFDFPAACAEESCLYPILEVPASATLDPGTRAFRVSADVNMRPSDTTTGSNIVQKGFSTGGGGQWKLQVDTLSGQPSCVVVAPGVETIHRVKSTVSIADSAWHTVSCIRTETALQIDVDGTSQSVRIPADIDLRNDAPVRVGGKSDKPGNDPFHGQIDDIQLTISR